MKKRLNFTLDIVEQSDNVIIYSILFEDEKETEFIKFIKKYNEIDAYTKDVQRIISYIDKIKENGALERYFRPEGKFGQNIKAIPVEINKLRLYAIRLTDNILIVGKGGNKKTRTYNEDPELNKIVDQLTQLSYILKHKIESGVINIDDKVLKGNLSFYYKE